MKITFLGTGTSQGVPLIGCDCEVCISSNTKDKRLRTSILLETGTTTVVIDSGPDFRQQLLRAGVKKMDGLVITHSHKDHIAGMDDVRAFNYLTKKPVNVYATSVTQQAIKKEFEYAFSGVQYPGIPEINLHTITKSTAFNIGDIHFKPIEVMHHKMPVLGFRIADFTYITDANFISEAEMKKIKGTSILVLNALRKETHISHFTLNQAIAIAQNINPNKTYFTHISHQLGKHKNVEKELPDHFFLAYDGLAITI